MNFVFSPVGGGNLILTSTSVLRWPIVHRDKSIMFKIVAKIAGGGFNKLKILLLTNRTCPCCVRAALPSLPGHFDPVSGCRFREVVRLSRAHEEASPSDRIGTSRSGLGFYYPCRIYCQLRSLEQTVEKPIKVTMYWNDRFRKICVEWMSYSAPPVFALPLRYSACAVGLISQYHEYAIGGIMLGPAHI